MANIFFKNKLIPERSIQAVEASLSSPSVPPSLSNGQINDLTFASSYFYGTNNLVIQLAPSAGEVDIDRFWTNTDGIVPISAWALWKTSNEETTFLRDQFSILGSPDRTAVNMVSVSSDRTILEIELKEKFIAEVEALFTRHLGVETPPEFGFLAITIPFGEGVGSRSDRAGFVKTYIFKYTHNSPFTTPSAVSPEGPAVAVNEYTTAPTTFENLFIPAMSGNFVYNFYEINEGSFDIARRRNFRGRSVRDIPKFVHLSWKKAPPSFESVGVLEARESETIGVAGETTESEGDRGISFDGIYFRPSTSLFTGLFSSFIDSSFAGDDSAASVSESDFIPRGSSITDSGGSLAAASSDLSPIPRETRRAAAVAEIGPESLETLGEEYVASTAMSEYVGYIILKERVTIEGEIEPIDIIVVPNIEQTSWIDWKVAYGETYRYRIRSIFRYVNRDNLPIFSDSDALLSRSGSAEAYDRGALFSKTHYFDSQYSEPVLIEVVDRVRPDPPQNIQIFPNSKEKRIFITWNQKQQNKDVIGYNVYRKGLEDKSQFARLNRDLINIRHNFWIDESLEETKEYVYAIEAVDIHSNRSYLSNQYIASIREYSVEYNQLCEEPVRIYEIQGLELNQPRRPKESETLIFKNKFGIMINPFYTNLDENTIYLLKVESLDTFQEKEIKLKFKTKIINHTPPVITVDLGIEDRRTELDDITARDERLLGDSAIGRRT